MSADQNQTDSVPFLSDSDPPLSAFIRRLVSFAEEDATSFEYMQYEIRYVQHFVATHCPATLPSTQCRILARQHVATGTPIAPVVLPDDVLRESCWLRLVGQRHRKCSWPRWLSPYHPTLPGMKVKSAWRS